MTQLAEASRKGKEEMTANERASDLDRQKAEKNKR